MVPMREELTVWRIYGEGLQKAAGLMSICNIKNKSKLEMIETQKIKAQSKHSQSIVKAYYFKK